MNKNSFYQANGAFIGVGHPYNDTDVNDILIRSHGLLDGTFRGILDTNTCLSKFDDSFGDSLGNFILEENVQFEGGLTTQKITITKKYEDSPEIIWELFKVSGDEKREEWVGTSTCGDKKGLVKMFTYQFISEEISNWDDTKIKLTKFKKHDDIPFILISIPAIPSDDMNEINKD